MKIVKSFVAVLLSVVLVLVFNLSVFAETTGTTELHKSATLDEEVDIDESLFKQDVSETIQQRIPDVSDDFRDDKVLVLINHENSLQLKNYQASDFNDVQALSVEKSIYNYKIGESVVAFIQAERALATEKLKQKYPLRQQQITDLVENTQLTLGSNYNVSQAKKAEITKLVQEKNIKIFDVKKDISDEVEKLLEKYTLKERNITSYKQALVITLPVHSKQNVIDAIKILQQRDDIYSAEPNYLFPPDNPKTIVATQLETVPDKSDSSVQTTTAPSKSASIDSPASSDNGKSGGYSGGVNAGKSGGVGNGAVQTGDSWLSVMLLTLLTAVCLFGFYRHKISQ